MPTKKSAKKQQKNIKNNKKSSKKKYKIRNWREYNESLVQRGALDVWIEESVIEQWYAEPTGKQGAQPVYSDLAIQLVLQFGKVFHQKLRQTEGLVKSIFNLMNIDLDIPDHTTIGRRGSRIEVAIPKDKKENVVLIADSSGLKVYGEGEWKVRKHGWSKHRTWRKIHLMITPDGEIRAAELTENNISDADVVPSLLNQENASIDKFAGDGAYDKTKVYDACREKKAKKLLIPPQKNAKIRQHGNCKAPPRPRDENLRQIRKSTRKRWKIASGYHVRSMVENTMFRYKTILGDKLNARKFENQNTEFLIGVSILNKMSKLGMPDSYAVT